MTLWILPKVPKQAFWDDSDDRWSVWPAPKTAGDCADWLRLLCYVLLCAKSKWKQRSMFQLLWLLKSSIGDIFTEIIHNLVEIVFLVICSYPRSINHGCHCSNTIDHSERYGARTSNGSATIKKKCPACVTARLKVSFKISCSLWIWGKP